MKAFSVTGTGYVTVYTTVEADSLEEAKEKVDKLSDADFEVFCENLDIGYDSMYVAEIVEE